MTDLDATDIPDQRATTAGAGEGPHTAAARYLAGWNAHDGEAVAAVVTGSYLDPTLPAPISGGDLAAYVDGLCRAFPDLAFEPVGEMVDGERIVTQWRMRGTNDGEPLPGAPAPTGGSVDLPGVDVITTRDGQVVDVVGYFDQKTFVEQLGLQALVMPRDEWPVGFGTSNRVDLGNRVVPGALSMTWIEVDEADAAELQQRSTDIITGLASTPAFIGFVGAAVGGRHFTLTAWTSPEAAEAALARSAAHNAAMDRLNRESFGRRGFTSLWQPYRVNNQFVVCPDCDAKVWIAAGEEGASCSCGGKVVTEPYL